MSDSPVNEYRFYCPTDATYFFAWGTTEPTQCPNCHAIDESSIAIVQTRKTNDVVAYDPINGTYQAETILIDVPAGQIGDTYVQSITWPFDTDIWVFEIYATQEMVNDSIRVITSPNTVIGVITTDANISDTILNVSPTVLQYAAVGYDIKITHGIVTQELGRVKNVNTSNSQITVETPISTSDFVTGSYLTLNAISIRNHVFNYVGLHKFGAKGNRTKRIFATMPTTLYYTNQSVDPKPFYLRLEYYCV